MLPLGPWIIVRIDTTAPHEVILFCVKNRAGFIFSTQDFLKQKSHIFWINICAKTWFTFWPETWFTFWSRNCMWSFWSPARGSGRVLLVCHSVICIFSVVKNCYKTLLRGFDVDFIENIAFDKNCRPPYGKAYKISGLGERAPKGRASPSRWLRLREPRRPLKTNGKRMEPRCRFDFTRFHQF